MTPLNKELLSIDEPFKQHGFSLLLRSENHEGGVCELYRPPTDNTPPIRIPIRYDHQNGGWWIDYVPIRYREHIRDEHRVLHARVQELSISNIGANGYHELTEEETRDLLQLALHDSSDIQSMEHYTPQDAEIDLRSVNKNT